MTEILQTGGEKLNKSELKQMMGALALRLETEDPQDLNPDGVNLLAGQLRGVMAVLDSPALRVDQYGIGTTESDIVDEIETESGEDPIERELEEMIDATPVEDSEQTEDSEAESENEISPRGLRLLQSIFGELESVGINSGDYEVITQLLYRLKYDGKVRRKDEVSNAEFKARLIGNFSGLTDHEVAEGLGTTNTAIAQFYGSIARTLKKDFGENQSEAREQFVGTILKARNAEDVSDELEFKLSSVSKQPEVLQAEESSGATPKLAKHALKIDKDLVDETYAYESRIVGSARAQVRHEAKKLGHDIIVSQAEYDDLALIELMRVTIERHHPGVDSFDLVSRYVNNRLILTDKVESSVNASMHKWLAEALISEPKEVTLEDLDEVESQVEITEEPKEVQSPRPLPVAPKPLSYTPPNYEKVPIDSTQSSAAETSVNNWAEIDGEQSKAEFRAEIIESLQAKLSLTNEQRASLQARATYDEVAMSHLELSNDTKEALRKLRVHSFGTVDWSEYGLTAGEVFDLFTSPLDPHNVDQINKKLHAKAHPSVASKKVWKTLRIVASAE